MKLKVIYIILSCLLLLGLNSISMRFSMRDNMVVIADTVYLEGDVWDCWDMNGVEMTDQATVVFCYSPPTERQDGYWAFPITSDIYESEIDSIKLGLYISSDGGIHKLYGLQIEDCGEIESLNCSETERTTAFITLNAVTPAGDWLSNNIVIVFNEWVNDYSHSETDHFGIAIDDNSSTNYAASYDACHGSYDNDTYLIFYKHKIVTRLYKGKKWN